MLPRTTDKLRAALPGGKVGAYWVRGSNPLLPSLSLVLLDGIIGDALERVAFNQEEGSTFSRSHRGHVFGKELPIVAKSRLQ
jgi:hypothetical protein